MRVPNVRGIWCASEIVLSLKEFNKYIPAYNLLTIDETGAEFLALIPTTSSHFFAFFLWD